MSAAPTFYVVRMPVVAESGSVAVFSLLASVFGAIHCISWSLGSFPSDTAQSMWRACALYITISPIVCIIFQVLVRPWNHSSNALIAAIYGFATYVLAFSVLLYTPARVILVVIGFWSLSSIPATGHQSIEWAEFIPHL